MRIIALLAASAAVLSVPGAAAPTPKERAALEAAVKADHDAAVKRLQDWIKLPTIAAENLNAAEGAEYMRRLALDAGFQQAKVIPTSGVPGVLATLDAGAKDCIGVYFMYDVKQYDPAEWTSPPLEARIVDRPGEGKAIVGRGAVNQKGPETAFLSAVRAFTASGSKLPMNVVLVAEGEEEIASPNFHQVIAQQDVREALSKCVGVFIPFNAQNPDGSGSVNLGAKGAVELQLIVGGETSDRYPGRILI